MSLVALEAEKDVGISQCEAYSWLIKEKAVVGGDDVSDERYAFVG